MVERIKERIKELEAKLNMNSSNSSKPPSTDNKLTKKRKVSIIIQVNLIILTKKSEQHTEV